MRYEIPYIRDITNFRHGEHQTHMVMLDCKAPSFITDRWGLRHSTVLYIRTFNSSIYYTFNRVEPCQLRTRCNTTDLSVYLNLKSTRQTLPTLSSLEYDVREHKKCFGRLEKVYHHPFKGRRSFPFGLTRSCKVRRQRSVNDYNMTGFTQCTSSSIRYTYTNPPHRRWVTSTYVLLY